MTVARTTRAFPPVTANRCYRQALECSEVGPVLELIMSERDLVETRPDARFHGMPIAMSPVILRRAMWPVPLERGADASALRVGFDGRQQVLLDALGDWQPVPRR